MQLIVSLLINSVAVFAAGYFLPGIQIENFWTAILIAVVLGILNTFVKPILTIISLPITIITLGLFVLVIDALLILLTSAFIPGFHVENFWWALIFAVVLSIVSSILHSVFNK